MDATYGALNALVLCSSVLALWLVRRRLERRDLAYKAVVLLSGVVGDGARHHRIVNFLELAPICLCGHNYLFHNYSGGAAHECGCCRCGLFRERL